MCHTIVSEEVRPELALAQILKPAVCGPGIDASRLRKIIREHWSKVAALAHKIHDEPEEPHTMVFTHRTGSTSVTVAGLRERPFLKRMLTEAGFQVIDTK